MNIRAKENELSKTTNDFLVVSDTYNDKLMTLKCTCGNTLTINGNGWELYTRGNIDFICKCGETISIHVDISPSGEVGYEISNNDRRVYSQWDIGEWDSET